MPSTTPTTTLPHTRLEDVAALLTGTTLVAVGVAFFTQAGLLTGGMVGLAFSLHYLTGWGFGLWFFAMNLPFYWLAVRHMGWPFTLKTFAAVVLLAIASDVHPQLLQLRGIHPAYAAVVGGILTGVGMLVLFRHRASLGGVGIAALYLQARYGWRAGHVQMGLDVVILLSAFFTLEPELALWSVLAAVTLNQVLSMNHRPGRYGGQ